MSPSDLQNEIMKRLRNLTKDFPLDTKSLLPLSDNDTTPFKIFRQTLPEMLHDMDDYRDEDEKDKDIYPFMIVNLPGGKQESRAANQIEPVQILIAVKNKDKDNRGFSDLLEAVQIVIDDFNENPIVNGLYDMQYPIEWMPYEEENTFPYFFAQVTLRFEIVTTVYRGGLDDDERNW
ncbi:hypothetical protein BN1050_02642 [Metalysinibacillus saudimassiliensis]|uniref:Uncharacterized protein n=1 Tax=Metalysinibacillus saudimassiliensis TaxID=1461583 RepID=A0A078MHL1_9BACL|nr:hypothetical protein BN1050_02642 [Metalysinibacillus saudimassiliensis]